MKMNLTLIYEVGITSDMRLVAINQLQACNNSQKSLKVHNCQRFLFTLRVCFITFCFVFKIGCLYVHEQNWQDGFPVARKQREFKYCFILENFKIKEN